MKNTIIIKENKIKMKTKASIQLGSIDYEWTNRPKRSSYDADCEHLKENNLYEDKGYIYASKWLCKEIPNQIIHEIKDIISIMEK